MIDRDRTPISFPVFSFGSNHYLLYFDLRKKIIRFVGKFKVPDLSSRRDNQFFPFYMAVHFHFM